MKRFQEAIGFSFHGKLVFPVNLLLLEDNLPRQKPFRTMHFYPRATSTDRLNKFYEAQLNKLKATHSRPAVISHFSLFCNNTAAAQTEFLNEVATEGKALESCKLAHQEKLKFIHLDSWFMNVTRKGISRQFRYINNYSQIHSSQIRHPVNLPTLQAADTTANRLQYHTPNFHLGIFIPSNRGLLAFKVAFQNPIDSFQGWTKLSSVSDIEGACQPIPSRMR